MKIVMVTLLCCTIFALQVMGESRKVECAPQESLFPQYFSDVILADTYITLVLKPSGQHYFIKTESEKMRKSEYGETICVEMGQTLSVIGRDSNIVFSPLPTISQGFLITETFVSRHEKEPAASNRFEMYFAHGD